MIKNQKDFLAGLLFLAVGVGFAWAASAHEIGAFDHMGSGMFPLALGGFLALLGVALSFKALTFETVGGGRIRHWGLGSLWRVLAGLLWLALCNGPAHWPWMGPALADWPTLGLVAGVGGLLLAVLPWQGAGRVRIWWWALVFAVLVCLAWLGQGLGMPLWPVWPGR